jgi:branched-chain amino acid transport system ATP-binding protein
MLLEVEDLDAYYGDFQALFGVQLAVAAGEAVALVGANGAGKSTLLKCIAGLMAHKRDRVQLAGADVGAWSAERIARHGVALLPEGRRLFASLTVEENLLMGAGVGRAGPWTLARVYQLFPLLSERRRQRPETLSGGQQGLVAIGRALMANPALLLCDEISLGLSPIAVEQLYAALAGVRAAGTALVLIEQTGQRAAAASERLYCLLEGRITLHQPSRTLGEQQLRRAYFG